MNEGGSALQVQIASPLFAGFHSNEAAPYFAENHSFLLYFLRNKNLPRITAEHLEGKHRTGGNPVPRLFYEGTGRRTKGMTGWTASPQHLERWWGNNPGKYSQACWGQGGHQEWPAWEGDDGQPENILGWRMAWQTRGAVDVSCLALIQQHLSSGSLSLLPEELLTKGLGEHTGMGSELAGHPRVGLQMAGAEPTRSDCPSASMGASWKLTCLSLLDSLCLKPCQL